MAKFNPVPAEVLHYALLKAGFVEAREGREIVYERANHNAPCLKVRVYTSAHVGQETVAACGKDAIRTVLLYLPRNRSKGRPVKKGSKRVFRVGTTEAIVSRMLKAARELYGFANQMAKVPGCAKCGAPCYPESRSCADYCWRPKSR
jgi:hypothetical protein